MKPTKTKTYIKYDRLKVAVPGELLTKVPPSPDGYSPQVAEVFRLVCEDLMFRGRLTIVVLHLVAQYCDSYQFYLIANDTLAQEGFTVDEETTGATRKHPAMQARKDAIAEMLALEKRIGITPYSRDKIPVDDKAKKREVDTSDPIILTNEGFLDINPNYQLPEE